MKDQGLETERGPCAFAVGRGIKGEGGAGYDGILTNGAFLGNGEELLIAFHWTPVRLLATGTSFLVTMNSINCGVQAVTNLNSFLVSGNDTYLVSQVFAIAK